MNYDIAKQLKDAGFPQPEREPFIKKYLWPESQEQEDARRDNYESAAYSPTLSELIKECGKNFFFLELTKEDTFRALGWNEDEKLIATKESYETAEEAIAHLWLAINKK